MSMPVQPAKAPSYGLITKLEDAERLVRLLISQGAPFGFDIETSYHGEPREKAATHPEENYVVGVSLTNSLHWARYIPVAHDDGTNVSPGDLAPLLWELLHANAVSGNLLSGLGVAHGAKFELRCLARFFMRHLADHPLFGKAVRATSGYYPIRSCTLLESHAEGENKSHGLKEITRVTFGHQMTELMDLFETGLTKKQQKEIRFSGLDQHDPKVYRYACEDALWALANHYHRYDRVKDTLIYTIEMGNLMNFCEMEDEGVLVDWNFYREASARCHTFTDRYQAEIQTALSRLAGEQITVNLASPAQVQEMLYGRLGMPVRRRSRKTNKPSTDKVALTGLSKQYPVVKKLLTWKSLKKLTGTYLDVYEKRFGWADDGRTHPSHIQHAVAAGRIAVADWPYQQSPKEYHLELESGDRFDFNFRNGVKAPAGWYMLGFDYSQAELRVLAGEAGEAALIEAFANGEDVHVKTAALMLHMAVADVADEHRKIGKTLNFAMGYQMGVDGLADRLGISKEEAEDLFAQYFAIYPRIKSYMERIVGEAQRTGYVFTRFGRRIRIWEFESTERYMISQGERLAGNAPIQGGAADYMKLAMMRARAALDAAGLRDRVRLVMNIHDALEFYVRDDVDPAEVIRVLQPAVVFPVPGWPPMAADWHVGRRWGDVRELELLDDGTVRVKGAEPGAELVNVADDPDEDGPALPDVDAASLRAVLGRETAGGGAVEVMAGPAVEPPVEAGGLDAGRAVGAAVPGADGGAPARTVVVDVPGMPTLEQAQALRASLARIPGLNTVVLVTPQGRVQVPGTSALEPSHQPDVALILGDCLVSYDLDSVDYQSLSDGLRF